MDNAEELRKAAPVVNRLGSPFCAVAGVMKAGADEIERLRAHPVFAHATGYHADPVNNTLTIDFSADGAAQKAFDALPPQPA